MAHHKSALKRIRQSKKRRIYNRINKKSLKLALKEVTTAGTFDDAVTKLKAAFRQLDKIAAKGIIHKNTAANRKSALAKHVKNLQTQQN
ncbi:MAG: 30S ribosomal protein S20 [Bacteroidota bacterium]|jgi:small subunit ribosomal protein S20